jgi:hypothetical protein
MAAAWALALRLCADSVAIAEHGHESDGTDIVINSSQKEGGEDGAGRFLDQPKYAYPTLAPNSRNCTYQIQRSVRGPMKWTRSPCQPPRTLIARATGPAEKTREGSEHLAGSVLAVG